MITDCDWNEQQFIKFAKNIIKINAKHETDDDMKQNSIENTDEVLIKIVFNNEKNAVKDYVINDDINTLHTSIKINIGDKDIQIVLIPVGDYQMADHKQLLFIKFTEQLRKAIVFQERILSDIEHQNEKKRKSILCRQSVWQRKREKTRVLKKQKSDNFDDIYDFESCDSDSSSDEQQKAIQKSFSHGRYSPISDVFENTDKKIGLKNIGQTCYMNSVLQLLFCSDIYYQFLIRIPEGLQFSEENAERIHDSFSVQEVKLQWMKQKSIVLELQNLTKYLNGNENESKNHNSFEDIMHRIDSNRNISSINPLFFIRKLPKTWQPGRQVCIFLLFFYFIVVTNYLKARRK